MSFSKITNLGRDEKMSNIERNGSGCVDPTVDCIIRKECTCRKKIKEDYKYFKMKEEIKKLLDRNGYILEGPISLINDKTGRKRRIY